jgi:hypothetical protein
VEAHAEGVGRNVWVGPRVGRGRFAARNGLASARPPDCNGGMRWRAIIFDMDGTLTRPLLDFAAIRADIALTADDPILETMARMAPDARQRAEAVLRRHEDAAARRGPTGRRRGSIR